jgi:hypothetical protein
MASKPACKFGSKCYRKNKDHFKNYEHSDSQDTAEASPAVRDTEERDENICPDNSKPSIETNKRKLEENELSSKEKIAKSESNPVVKKTVDQNIEKFDLTAIKDIKAFVHEHNGMHMPEDFYNFLEFCKSLDSTDPKSI